MAKAHPRGRRGLNRDELLEAAFNLASEEGEAGFSLRKLGARIGVDPMTILHHFGSKEGLMREIADFSLRTIAQPEPTGDWKQDLRRVADAYRDLAHRYPRLFHLQFRYHATGPQDHALSEVVYRAMRGTGLPSQSAAGLGLAFFAFVLGFALSETEGLLKPLNAAEEAELEALDAEAFAATKALVPNFKALDADAAFAAAIGSFISGIELQHQDNRPRTRR